jgi:putative membrane protein
MENSYHRTTGTRTLFATALIAACAALPLTIADPAVAQTATSKAAAPKNVSSKDKKFIEEAAAGGMLEVQGSQLALQRATDPEVKQFADHMVKDHEKVNQQLMTLVSAKGVQPPAQLPMMMRSKLNSLSKEEGVKFDDEYMDKIGVDAHKDTVKLFEKAAKNLDDAELKKFAADTLPSLKQHLTMAQQLDAKIDKKMKASKK